MKNKIITPIIALLLLSTQQLIAQVNGKRNTPAIDSVKVIDTALTFKPHNAHDDSLPNSTQIRICGPSRAGLFSSSPLYILKNNKSFLVESSFMKLNPTDIKAINIIKDTSILKLYSYQGTRAVVEITLKEDSVFFSVEKILRVYDLPKKYKKLPVFIDGKPFAKYEILLERSKIKTVSVVTRLISGINKKKLEITTVDKQTTPL